jgi:monoamine oxidase
MFVIYLTCLKFEQTARKEIVRLRNLTEAASLDPKNFIQPEREKLDSITFEQWCRSTGVGTQALQTARVWCRGTTGQDPSDLSALAYLEVCRGALGLVNLRHDGKDGGQYLRLEEGTQSIAIGMSKLLPCGSIRLSTPVSAITSQNSSSYTITTARGEILRARKVIVSVPGPAYKTITFSPPLPPVKQSYTTAARYGCFIKFVCLFETPFWRQQGACGLAQSFRGPINHCRDTSVDHSVNYALTCFLCAGPGRKWLALGKEDRSESVLKQLGSLFGVGYEAVKDEFRGSITSEWTDDRWAGWGCPFAIMPPGTIGHCELDDVAHQKSGGMYFVGTELTNVWRGYMEGALRSGQRGASQALEDLRIEQALL